jgi:16S rRNA (uracil1498-N3)-methyltransferase
MKGSMHKLYVSAENILNDQITVSEVSVVHHFKDVLRLKLKEKVMAVDNRMVEYFCLVQALLPDKIILEIKEKRMVSEKDKIKLTVACAIPKKAKMDEIIDKLTQLGVDKIIPLETERVIIKLDAAKKVDRLKCWEKISQSASEQSKRNSLPQVKQVQSIADVLKDSIDYDLKLIPTLDGERKSLKEVFEKNNPRNILVFIGPEGDFTSEEINLAVKSGCIPVTLGDLVLRVDTAAVAVASFISLYAK